MSVWVSGARSIWFLGVDPYRSAFSRFVISGVFSSSDIHHCLVMSFIWICTKLMHCLLLMRRLTMTNQGVVIRVDNSDHGSLSEGICPGIPWDSRDPVWKYLPSDQFPRPSLRILRVAVIDRHLTFGRCFMLLVAVFVIAAGLCWFFSLHIVYTTRLVMRDLQETMVSWHTRWKTMWWLKTIQKLRTFVAEFIRFAKIHFWGQIQVLNEYKRIGNVSE